MIELSGIGQLSIEHHAQVAVVWQLLYRFLGSRRGLRPLLGVAIRVDDFLIATARIFIAQGQHLAEGFDGCGVVFLLPVDHAQALDEDRAIVAVGLAGAGFALLCFLDQILQNLGGLIVTSLRLVNGSYAVGDVHGVRNERFRPL